MAAAFLDNLLSGDEKASDPLMMKTDAYDMMFNEVINMPTFDASTWEDPLVAHAHQKESTVAEQEKIVCDDSTAPCNSPTEVMAGMPPLTPVPKRRPLTAKAGSKRKLLATSMGAIDDGSGVVIAEAVVAEAVEALDDDDANAAVDPASSEDKQQRRMQRNRESAAESRKRKKQKVEDLEALIASLQREVEALKEANETLRYECVVAGTCGDSLPCAAAAAGPTTLLPGTPLRQSVGSAASGAA